MYGTQCLDHPGAHPTPAVHSDAGRLVDHDEVAIFVDDSSGHELSQRLGRRFRRVGILLAIRVLQRRQPYPVARDQPIGRLGASAVYAHLTGPQDAVNEASWH